MAITDNQYTGLITSEHNQQPNYMAMVALLTQPMVDNQNALAMFAALFNIYTAVGEQLDFLGQWIGASRFLTTDIDGTNELNDADYRLLLEAVIAANHWDGTVPGAYAIWAVVFAQQLFQIFIQDNQDMTMFYVFIAASLTTVVKALLLDGYLTLVPAGVKLLGYFEPSVPGVPMFGFDAENATVSGFDVGAFVVPIT